MKGVEDVSKEQKERLLNGTRIRKLREDEGWTIDELSDRIGVNGTYIHQMERGHKPVTINMAKLYRSIFNTTLDHIYFGTKGSEK